ncbi:helix-turn-helix transcriptional regulator [Leucobacter coleopterorum]|uniref:Helix-turn-helix transcriptional regulator n=1 Tax=Leucobacter coleopterorum TaxID=2714933 RepID=A0ABX6JXN2_9MICO|nr:helix-turn-helix transcriptional regulator [Leucobacter coleopterorum]QIM17594.1 helix-turn-helix transcriptional regulator [Leucobacter coleopterorum]
MDAATIVKRIRSTNGITRKELAELAALSPSTVGRIERGEIDPTWGTLTRLLASTGYQINGDSLVSAGDASAVAAAQPLLSAVMTALEPSTRALRTSIVASAQDTAAAAAQDIARLDWSEAWKSVVKSITDPRIPLPSVTSEWRNRWERAGWLDESTDANDFVTLAISAGNAAKISRRNTVQRAVDAPEGWQTLARRLGRQKKTTPYQA